MTPPIAALSVPLNRDEFGVARVAGTRVTLHSVVRTFELGATPEEIVQRFDSLSIGDVYAVIAWYLANRAEVDAELLRYEGEADVIRAELERSGLVARDLRARLVRRGPGRPG